MQLVVVFVAIVAGAAAARHYYVAGPVAIAAGVVGFVSAGLDFVVAVPACLQV